MQLLFERIVKHVMHTHADYHNGDDDFEVHYRLVIVGTENVKVISITKIQRMAMIIIAMKMMIITMKMMMMKIATIIMRMITAIEKMIPLTIMISRITGLMILIIMMMFIIG